MVGRKRVNFLFLHTETAFHDLSFRVVLNLLQDALSTSAQIIYFIKTHMFLHLFDSLKYCEVFFQLAIDLFRSELLVACFENLLVFVVGIVGRAFLFCLHLTFRKYVARAKNKGLRTAA